jgi:hypothetical protein
MNVEAINIYQKIRKNNGKINDANSLIYKCREENSELTKKLFKTCQHEWIYDENANFDDKCKYICRYCRLYRNPHWN